MSYRPLNTIVKISPAIWPGLSLKVQPGDLSQFAQMGLGMGGPGITKPFDDPVSVESRRDHYGYQRRGSHPLHDAPRSSDTGGFVYFGHSVRRESVDALLDVLGVGTRLNQYAVFIDEADDPAKAGALVQARIIRPYALETVFDAKLPESQEKLPREPFGTERFRVMTQPFDVKEFVWRFIENQCERWEEGWEREVSGLLGGDGDWAREALGFGFMVENSYNGIYRVWSRLWLCTK